MYVRVDLVAAPPTVTVEEPDDLTRLHLEAHGDADELASRTALGEALQHSGLGQLDDGEAVLDVRKLRAFARHGQPPEWDEGFDKMIDYARSKGWVTDDRVRAHVVWRPVG